MNAYNLEEAARLLWDAGNEYMRNPRPGPHTTVLNFYRAPGVDIGDIGGPGRDAAFMLLGFALENLVKGIIVCREPALVTKEGLEKWPGNSHDLEALFDKAGISVTPEERVVLKLATQLTEWSGRYPVPMTFNKANRLGGWPPTVYAVLSDLSTRAKEEIKKTMAAIPPLPEGHEFAEKRRR